MMSTGTRTAHRVFATRVFQRFRETESIGVKNKINVVNKNKLYVEKDKLFLFMYFVIVFYVL